MPPGFKHCAHKKLYSCEWFDRNGVILRLEGMCDLDLFETEQITGEQ